MDGESIRPSGLVARTADFSLGIFSSSFLLKLIAASRTFAPQATVCRNLRGVFRVASGCCLVKGNAGDLPLFGSSTSSFSGFQKKSMDKTLLKHNGALPKITLASDEPITQPPVMDTRKQSTGTLNRLILVSQALEAEVDSRRRNDVNGSRIVMTIRMANLVLLMLVNALIFTGVGQYQGRNGQRQSLMLTANKWIYRRDLRLPFTFSEMRLSGQFVSASLCSLMLAATAILQLIHLFKLKHSKLMVTRRERSRVMDGRSFQCICYSFGCVPFSLLVFGLEMH